MAYLPTNIVAGQTGHIAHSNQAYEGVNSIRGSNGYYTINVQNPPAGLVPAVGDGITDDNAALQAIFDYVKLKAGEYEIWFPNVAAGGAGTAAYVTSKPLIVWSNTRLRGPAVLQEHPTFNWVNHPHWQLPEYIPAGNPQPGDIALLELWNRVTGRGGISRLYINDVTLQGRDTPGSLGFLSKYQQPGYTMKFRIRNFDTGWALWGQESEHYGTVIDGDGVVGLYLGANIGGLNTFSGGVPNVNVCKFMSFYALNVEGSTQSHILMESAGPNWIFNSHFEMNPNNADPAGCHVIEAIDSSFHIRNAWATHDGNNNHVFVMTNAPGSTGTSHYSIEDFRLGSSNTGGQRFVDDQTRGFIRLVDLQRTIDVLRTIGQNSTEHNYDAGIEFLGDNGGTIRFGGVKGGTAAPTGHSGSQATFRPNLNQADPTLQFQDSGAVMRAGVQNGNLFGGVYTNATRPSAATLRQGTFIINTDDNAFNLVSGGIWRDAMGVAT